MDIKEAERFLDHLMMFGIKLGLTQVRELLERVGSPDRGLRFIHIAGSNGKGSTGAMLNAALRRAGFRVGFYSSPHLVSVRERFRIDGHPIGEEEFAALTARFAPAVEDMKNAGRCPTYFELTTAMAALCFARHQTDFVIWETGMGGRFDATNVVSPLCSVITGISLEHQEYLGDSIAKIAFEKAGIIKWRTPVFTAATPPDAELVIREIALARQAPLHHVPPEWLNHNNDANGEFRFEPYQVGCPLRGAFQRGNAALATLVLEFLAETHGFDLHNALTGISDCSWPARLQTMPDGSLLDGAHNPEGAEALAAYLKSSGRRNLSVVFGGMKDKDSAAIIRTLAPAAAEFVFVPISTPRPARSPAELMEICRDNCNVPCRTADSLPAALATTAAETRVVTGSLYLAGELLRLMYPDLEAAVTI